VETISLLCFTDSDERTGLFPYDLCDKTFIWSHNFRIHLAMIHKGKYVQKAQGKGIKPRTSKPQKKTSPNEPEDEDKKIRICLIVRFVVLHKKSKNWKVRTDLGNSHSVVWSVKTKYSVHDSRVFLCFIVLACVSVCVIVCDYIHVHSA